MISFQHEFQDFWSQAKDQPLERQLELWNLIVEKPHQAFYDSVVWEKPTHPHRDDLKRRVLIEQFGRYRSLYPEIVERFQSFPAVTRAELSQFKRRFPDAPADFPIYAVPSPMFDAKGAVLDSQQVVLAFGIDTFLAIHDRYEIIYPHELFHIYHALKRGFINDGVMENVSIAVPMWAEGLATYVSGLFNETATDGDLLADVSLGKVPKEEIPQLARLFLQDAHIKAIDRDHPDAYRKWFSIGSARVRPDLPNRCGYLLGLHVARFIAENESLEEMARWEPPEADRRVLAALRAIADGR